MTEKTDESVVTSDVQRLQADLDRRNLEIKILKEVAAEVNASLDLDLTLRTLLQHLDHYFNYKHSMILLSDNREPFLTVVASHGYPEGGTGAKVRIGKGIIGIVARRKKMLSVPNINARMAYFSAGRNIIDNVENEITIKLPGLRNPRSQVAIPLLTQDELVGVLSVESDQVHVFKREDEEIISAIAEQAAMAIQKARFYEKEQKRVSEILEMNETLSALYRQQQETLNLFKKYVPETVVRKALREKPDSIFDGELLHIAVLFCDIRNFTETSENLSPAEVVTLLNTYYQKMNEVITRHEGVINQFVGDEIFVTFGAPIAIQNCEEKAVRCALEMIDKLSDLNEIVKDIAPSGIQVGIGINYGPVIAGNLGSEERIEYSITGDTVNTGKRIESLTKNQLNTVLVSETIYNQVKDAFDLKAWEPIHVKGKKEKVCVYEVLKASSQASLDTSQE